MKKQKKKAADPVPRILNVLPSPHLEKDWPFSAAEAAGMAARPRALPASVDLRATWWAIGDQGSTGSCVGWAAADSVLRWHLVKKGELARNVLLSPRFTWMASKETDEITSKPTTFIEHAGTTLKSAIDVFRELGCVEDAMLPFRGNLYGGVQEDFYAAASRFKIRSYFGMHHQPPLWKAWLARNGPILTRLDVDSTWMNATRTNGKLDRYRSDETRGGHAVALVGYTRDRFIVRNSWGTGWGDGGFAYASLAYAQRAFTESYGLIV